jgi:hypothetical protein
VSDEGVVLTAMEAIQPAEDSFEDNPKDVLVVTNQE